MICGQNLAVGVFMMAWLIACPSLAADEVILNETIKVVKFEPLTYPVRARLSAVAGAVVVRAGLSDGGSVIEASALAGPKDLIDVCVENIKKWQFAPNRSHQVIIIYNFTVKGLCYGSCLGQFFFEPPNVATIIRGETVVDH